MRTHKASTRKSSKQARNPDQPEILVFKQISLAQRQTRVITRVICDHFSISTNASGLVALQTIASSGGVTSAGNWLSFAGAATEYRCRGIEVEVFPLVPAQTNLTSPAPCYLAFAPWSSATIPTGFVQLLEGPGCKVLPGFKSMKFAASSKGYVDASLWTSTTAGIVSAEQFGICVSGPPSAPVAAISSTYFRGIVRWLVDFRSLD